MRTAGVEPCCFVKRPREPQDASLFPQATPPKWTKQNPDIPDSKTEVSDTAETVTKPEQTRIAKLSQEQQLASQFFAREYHTSIGLEYNAVMDQMQKANTPVYTAPVAPVARPTRAASRPVRRPARYSSSSDGGRSSRSGGRTPVRVMNPSSLSALTTWECKDCGRDVKAPKMREHVAAHILPSFDDDTIDPRMCGFCGRADAGCSIELIEGSNRNILVPYSDCEFYYKFNLKSAIKETTPCSNHPMHCPAGCGEHVVIWKYVMRRHLATVHPKFSPSPRLISELKIHRMERDRLVSKALDFPNY